MQGKTRRGPRSLPVDPVRGNHVLSNRHEEVTMYPNTYFSRAAVSVVTSVLVALGPLGSFWSATEFMPAPVLPTPVDAAMTDHPCDIAVMVNTQCQDGQHRHGSAPTIGRAYRDLNSRPTA
ncbi:hypothetical protein [Mycolicibacterium phocaicum]|uniref:hypothetical protein n=2 Tax=Mycolicibacterium TaxID=1866885 RepID=UPI001CF994C5|nr:hypothetical protein [Mycolicibacterium phocaicum]UCZ62732.1 hypothetical protein LHJ73_11420 [Mycolicibacterium phocaicum]